MPESFSKIRKTIENCKYEIFDIHKICLVSLSVFKFNIVLVVEFKLFNINYLF